MSSAGTMQRNVWRPLWELPHRSELIWSLAKRDLLARYKGSVLGIIWAVVTPVVMIAIFTFIFAGIFGARFGNSTSHWTYALYLFCGLIPWTMFQDTLQQSSTTIVNHSNLVKRVIFPLETLPVAQAFSALGNQLFASIALLLAVVVIEHRLGTHFHVVARAFDTATFDRDRRRLAVSIAWSFSEGYCSGCVARVDGVDVSDSHYLSGIRRAAQD
jgi:ABC-type polysaccharide/polyol phosphate export permease